MALLLSVTAAFGASSPEAQPLKPLAPAVALWEDAAPLAMGQADVDIPAITPYLLPARTDGQPRPCVIVCPGGSYSRHATHEGDFYAHWLNELGINAVVLRYRLGSSGYRHPVMLMDVARAVRFMRFHVADYGIDPQKIGVIGSSAGGHLVSTILTHFDAGDSAAADPVDRLSSRPDFGIILYPVISIEDDAITHKGTRENLLGKTPDPALMRLLSNHLQVKDDTPPSFLVHSMRDKGVPAKHSLLFALALEEHGVPYELHVYDFSYEFGGHGFGLGHRHIWKPEQRHPWVKQCERWLRQSGFAPEN